MRNKEPKLDPDQQSIVDTDGKLVVASVAGSGKTHTLVHKIGRLVQDEGIDPSSIQVLTFSKRASEDFAQRLRLSYGHVTRRVPVRTFHSFVKHLIEKHGNSYRPGLSSTRILKPLDVHISLRKTLLQCGTALGMAHLVKWRGDSPPILRPKVAIEYCSACQDFLRLPDCDPFSEEHQAMLAKCGLEYDSPQLRVLHDAYTRWSAEKESRGWITYDDMISLAVSMLRDRPDIKDWVQSNIDHLFVDEYQDTSPAQQALVGLCGEQACWTLVGDDDQCHPPGVMVSTTGGEEIQIQDLNPDEHRLVSYSRTGSAVAGRERAGRSFEIESRPYDGLIHEMSVAGEKIPCTPNHKWLTRWSDKAKDKKVVYLMYRKDRGFRIGWCKLFRSDGCLHLGHRARIENADAAWVLAYYDSDTNASIGEKIISAQYGITQVVFEPPANAKHFTSGSLEIIFNAVPGTEGARQLLKDRQLEFEHPLWTAKKAYERRGGTSLMVIEAAAMPRESGIMEAPVPVGKTVDWISIHSELASRYSGMVYSLDVEKDKTYIANGVVTHNSIFGFRHANPELMIGMAEEAEERGELHRLQTNYRSGDDILQAANLLIAHNDVRIQKSLRGLGTDSEIVVSGHANRYSEAIHVARNILSAVEDGMCFRDCMVLMRTNAQAAEIIDAFLDAKIPYRLPQGVKPFHELPEVQDLEAYLRLIVDPNDELAVGQIANRPPRGVTHESLDSFHDEAQNHHVSPREAMLTAPISGNGAHFVRGRLEELNAFILSQHASLQPGGLEGSLDPDIGIEMPTKELLESVIAFTDYEGWIKGEGREEDNFRTENVRRCLAVAERHKDPRVFLNRLGLMREQERPQGNEVTVSTIHKAKGLESELVFLVGCKPGLLPHARAEETIDEERRLCYVAVTRAKYGLYISHDDEQGNLPDEVACTDFIAEMGLVMNRLAPEEIEEDEMTEDDDYVF